MVLTIPQAAAIYGTSRSRFYRFWNPDTDCWDVPTPGGGTTPIPAVLIGTRRRVPTRLLRNALEQAS